MILVGLTGVGLKAQRFENLLSSNFSKNIIELNQKALSNLFKKHYPSRYVKNISKPYQKTLANIIKSIINLKHIWTSSKNFIELYQKHLQTSLIHFMKLTLIKLNDTGKKFLQYFTSFIIYKILFA